MDTLDENFVCKMRVYRVGECRRDYWQSTVFGWKAYATNLSDEYVDRVFARFPDVKDSVDFGAYWFRLAHDQIGEKGRAGLVGTNSIRQGKSRTAALDYMVQNGDEQPVPYINSALKAAIDVSKAVRLKVNLNQCFQGITPIGKGFVISEAQTKD